MSIKLNELDRAASVGDLMRADEENNPNAALEDLKQRGEYEQRKLKQSQIERTAIARALRHAVKDSASLKSEAVIKAVRNLEEGDSYHVKLSLKRYDGTKLSYLKRFLGYRPVLELQENPECLGGFLEMQAKAPMKHTDMVNKEAVLDAIRHENEHLADMLSSSKTIDFGVSYVTPGKNNGWCNAKTNFMYASIGLAAAVDVKAAFFSTSGGWTMGGGSSVTSCFRSGSR